MKTGGVQGGGVQSCILVVRDIYIYMGNIQGGGSGCQIAQLTHVYRKRGFWYTYFPGELEVPTWAIFLILNIRKIPQVGTSNSFGKYVNQTSIFLFLKMKLPIGENIFFGENIIFCGASSEYLELLYRTNISKRKKSAKNGCTPT